jgi:hypothetical protein
MLRRMTLCSFGSQVKILHMSIFMLDLVCFWINVYWLFPQLGMIYVQEKS